MCQETNADGGIGTQALVQTLQTQLANAESTRPTASAPRPQVQWWPLLSLTSPYHV